MDLKNYQKSLYFQVANLHMQYIKEGFLPKLGIRFLTLLYEAIDKDLNSTLIVSKKDDKVIGFVSGSSNLSSVYKKLLMNFPRLIITILPSILNPKKMYKIFEIFLINARYKKQIDIILPKAELLSIVVQTDYQGQGVAENLFVELCNYFKNIGHKSFRIAVGESLNKAHAFYKKQGAFVLGEMEVHKGKNSIIYEKRIL